MKQCQSCQKMLQIPGFSIDGKSHTSFVDHRKGLVHIGNRETTVWLCNEGKGEVKIEHPDIKAVKHDDGKVQWYLLPLEATVEVLSVLMYGAKKYAPDNWRQGFDWNRPYDAAMRHMTAFWVGEDLDPECKRHHLACAICELMFLLTYSLMKIGNDNRKPKVP